MPEPVLITDDLPEAKELEVFVKNLGVGLKPTLYLYEKYVYINIDMLLPVLSVELKWFKKNADYEIHYIIIKKKVFINKYGLTKILAQSKEAVAFLLQDYIYEVIHKLETNGIVSKDDVISREELLKTLSELNLYQVADDTNKTINAKLRDELNELDIHYTIQHNQLTQLRETHTKLEDDYDELESRFKKLQDIATSLAKYIRFSKKKLSDAETSIVEELDDSDYDDGMTRSGKHIYREAFKAKKALKKTLAKPKLAETPISDIAPVNKQSYYIMISNETVVINNTQMHRWKLTTSLPKLNYSKIKTPQKCQVIDGMELLIEQEGKKYKDFKDFSTSCSIENITHEYDYLWYNDIALSKKEFNLLNTILDIIELSEAFVIDKILSAL